MARNLGTAFAGEIKMSTGNVPVATVAATLTGAAIDRLGLNACILDAEAGAVTGAPTSFTLDTKLQDSADGSTGWADFVPVTGTAASGAVAQITAASTRKRKSISLLKAKRYVRAVSVVAFVGGTAPTLGVASVVVLGAPDTTPAQADD
jgi:hypothetical protein